MMVVNGSMVNIYDKSMVANGGEWLMMVDYEVDDGSWWFYNGG